jgi:uncharacterized protein YyaL (SSP411 family)
MESTRQANRLIQETSPYLLQHAHNPVDWHPWDAEALATARRLDRPIFLSIGYSACHWCHVMERESFEDPQTADLLNQFFVNVKVDREERPDLDQIYMHAVQLMTQRGGWPMSVWLTPGLKPFFGGTYFPPTRQFGMPSFREVILAVADAWRNRRAEIEESANRLTAAVVQMGMLEPDDEKTRLDAKWIDEAAWQLDSLFDRTWGGIGRAPKFPHATELRLMLRAAARLDNQAFQDLVVLTLDRMIRGGIYDQLGGGFHRYSTDAQWLVPHFEKMLYDNALMPLVLLEAWQATGDQQLRQAAVETLDYVLREMTCPEGGFYSSQDADSEGEEGKFYVWSQTEFVDILGSAAEVVAYCYNVTPSGNWEGKNILNMPKTLPQASKLLRMPVEQLAETLNDARHRLFEARSRRVPPGRDDKILTAWNAMALEALALAGGVLDEHKFTAAAVNSARFLLENLRTQDGRLRRTFKDGRARLDGYLEDYAYLANSLVTLYETTFDWRWIRDALSLVETMIEQFWDGAGGGFFFTGKDHGELVARSKEPGDGATPAGSAIAATALARLARLTNRADLSDTAEQTLCAYRAVMERSPMQAAQFLSALGLHLGPTYELVIVGERDAPETRKILRAIHQRFIPNKVLALRSPRDTDPATPNIPLFAGKEAVGGRPTLHVCQNLQCQAPSVGLEAVLEQLERIAPMKAAL